MLTWGRMAGRLGGVVALMMLAGAVAAQSPSPPLPPPRPDPPAVPSPEPSDVKVPTKEDGAEPKAPEPSSADAACLERITRLGLRFESRPSVREKACSIDSPVLVSALPNGVEVAPASLMACPVAESLARWMSDAVAPEAERHFQSAPTKLLIGTSYQCRDQRNGEKLSEHAFGNGVDVMGFEFAKRGPLAISAHSADSPESAFQAAVQKAACPIFTTVLGPGSDAAHGDHLHLDLRQRKGDYRICQ
ncbi:extensin family protein [Microvirga aerilata]|uniref:Extensin family protein n=1 Tax=Microvirga aerilata TaxID=670292 RepID=A0A936ZHU5_9HYPH|nr:extensin family protein [Microvirga aerilata]MBL0404964.1 extensin family protein [Microvirga aerilata]